MGKRQSDDVDGSQAELKAGGDRLSSPHVTAGTNQNKHKTQPAEPLSGSLSAVSCCAVPP